MSRIDDQPPRADEGPDVRAEVARRDRVWRLLSVAVSLLIVGTWAFPSGGWWSSGSAGLLVAVVTFGAGLLLWRCPACGALPERNRATTATTCGACGARLRPEQTPGRRWGAWLTWLVVGGLVAWWLIRPSLLDIGNGTPVPTTATASVSAPPAP